MQPAPITFADPRRCQGVKVPVSGKPIDICIPCPLRTDPVPVGVMWVGPEFYAKAGADGVEVRGCKTREGFHTANDPRESRPGEPCEARGASVAKLGERGAA